MSWRSRTPALDALDGREFSITLPIDAHGFLGRECPASDCGRYFKVTPGTGLTTTATSRCPYCGHEAESSDFTTPDQHDYAKSVATRAITTAMLQDLRAMEFDYRPRPGTFGIGFSMQVEGRPSELRWYCEHDDLETRLTCDGCGLVYAIYGVFSWCFDCGLHNSLVMLRANLTVVGRALTLAEAQDPALAHDMLASALGQVVAHFDAFGRATCEAAAGTATGPIPNDGIRFQNLDSARTNVQTAFGHDLAAGLTGPEWTALVRGFQKRHLFAHRGGVVDAAYVRRSGDNSARVGCRVALATDEIQVTLDLVVRVAEALHAALTPQPSQGAPDD